MPIQIPQYETQHQANPPMAPTLTYAPGEQLGRAVAGFGESVSGFAANMMKVQDRDGKLEAAKIVAQAEVEVQEQLMQAGDQLGKDNPEGFAGEFNKTFDKQREVKMREAEKSSKNPYVGRYLKEGFDNLQRNTFISAMKVERDASHKYGQQQTADFVNANAKIAARDYAATPGMIERSVNFIDLQEKMPASWREEMKVKAAAVISDSAVAALIKTDPVKAEAVLADKENPIVAALSADSFDRLAPAARAASIDFQGRTNGQALAAEAFKSQNPLLIDKALNKIKDPDLRERTKAYANAEYNGMVSQKNQIETTFERNEYDRATEAAIKGIPYTPTGNVTSSYKQQKIVDYYNTMREQMLYTREGGATSDDLDYVIEVQAMLYNSDKTKLFDHHLDRTRLQASTFKSLNAQIERIRGDRNSKVSDVGPYVDNAFVVLNMNTPADKNKKAALKILLSSAVAQKEDMLKRPLNDEEMRQEGVNVLSQTYTEDKFFGLQKSQRRSYSEVPAAHIAKISQVMSKTDVLVDSENVRQVYMEMYSDVVRETFKRLILEENPDAVVTDSMIDDRYLMEYAAQNSRK